MNHFSKAKAVWKKNPINEWNQFMGFHSKLEFKEETEVTISIAARSFYRLYINGSFFAHGPARAAKGYCRVDRLCLSLKGEVHIAVECVAENKPDDYCNDITMEPGMFICEIIDNRGKVITYTGGDLWWVRELPYRREKTETLSHSRGILEYYDYSNDSFRWRLGEVPYGECSFESPTVLELQVSYLDRRTRLPDYHKISISTILDEGLWQKDDDETEPLLLKISEEVNPKWSEMISEENRILREVGSKPLPSKLFCIEKSEVGFLDFDIDVSDDCILDIICSDHLDRKGNIKINTYVTRYKLKTGKYHITTFEPKLVKYVRFVYSSKGNVCISDLGVLDYSFPDERKYSFICSDGELNAIYEGARRTLRLSTLDIFMDCPQRERGGWLCDSYYSAMAMHHMLGDLQVEKDFLENYMLTDPQDYDRGFFPDVYPGKRPDKTPGIRNWSFWLLEELYEYYERSGDRVFIDQSRKRVEACVEGAITYIGESGLLENLDSTFIDWSVSNRSFSLEPVSIPVNCLFCHTLSRMATLYERADWLRLSEDMRKIIKELDSESGIFGGGGDSASFVDGELKRGECPTESGYALELWSGFHRDDKKYRELFRRTMGIKPEYRSNPNIGKSNQFIGLMVRFQVLKELGYTDELLKEMKALYLGELRCGSGTFFENVNALSGCHGFNGAAGSLLTSTVLGLGQPLNLYKTVVISPHIMGINWAKGSTKCDDGDIYFGWYADHEEHILNAHLVIPKNWSVKYELPFELSGWKIVVNGKDILQERKK